MQRIEPRSFAAEPLSDAEVASLFEGARWSPSSFNGQPWLFLYETDGPDRTLFDSVLMPRNRAWASKAPLVGFIFANTRTPDGREPRTAQFDTGAAWMALTLQLRAEDYVIAAKIAGMREAGIIGNSCCRAFMSCLIVHLTLAIPGMILGETALSFIGVGLQPSGCDFSSRQTNGRCRPSASNMRTRIGCADGRSSFRSAGYGARKPHGTATR